MEKSYKNIQMQADMKSIGRIFSKSKWNVCGKVVDVYNAFYCAVHAVFIHRK